MSVDEFTHSHPRAIHIHTQTGTYSHSTQEERSWEHTHANTGFLRPSEREIAMQ